MKVALHLMQGAVHKYVHCSSASMYSVRATAADVIQQVICGMR